jgi:hypothetical protein
MAREREKSIAQEANRTDRDRQTRKQQSEGVNSLSH